MTDSARLSKKQQACVHANLTRVAYAKSWGVICEDCYLRFSPHPLLVGVRRDLEVALTQQRYWQEMSAKSDHNTVTVRDELKKVRDENEKRNIEILAARQDRDKLQHDIEAERDHRIRETTFLRGLLIRAVELAQE